MTTDIEVRPRNGNGAGGDIMERVLIAGDLAKLQPNERVSYYKAVCDSLGLNPLTRPFEYINLSGRLVLYARKDCTDQLRTIRRVDITDLRPATVGDLYVVTAKAQTPDGRCDQEIGAVNVARLTGEALANAMMKATTKAKRRVTLSLCGLGFLDETEVDSVPPDQRRAYRETTAETPDNAPPALPAPPPPAPFCDRWLAAIEARGGTAEDADRLLAGLLKKKGKTAITDLSPAEQDRLIGFVNEGKYDAYLRKPEPASAAPAPGANTETGEVFAPDAMEGPGEPDSWADFLVDLEDDAKNAGIDPDQFDRGVDKFVVRLKSKGIESTITDGERAKLRQAVVNRQGYFAVPAGAAQ